MNPYKATSILLFIALVILILLKGCEKHEVQIRKVTDTVFVDKIKIVNVEVKTPPEKIYIQKKADTVYRNYIQSKTIIVGEKIENGKLDVQTIDTLGVIKDAEFSLGPDQNVRVNNEGEVEIEVNPKEARRKKRVKFARRVLTVATFIAGVFIGKGL